MSQDNCPACGKSSQIKGTLQSTGFIHFRPSEAKFLTFCTADIPVHANMCSSCGWITLIGNAKKLEQLKYTPCRKESVPSVGGGA